MVPALGAAYGVVGGGEGDVGEAAAVVKAPLAGVAGPVAQHFALRARLGVVVACCQAGGVGLLGEDVVGVGKPPGHITECVAHFDQVARFAVGVADERARLGQQHGRGAALCRGAELHYAHQARAAGVDSPEGEGGFLRRRCIFGAPFGKAPSRI